MYSITHPFIAKANKKFIPIEIIALSDISKSYGKINIDIYLKLINKMIIFNNLAD